MRKHHAAWLEAHPERSRDWLKKMIEEGFDVHHIDNDSTNNHPANLALIESVDHMRLHGLYALARPNMRETLRNAAIARWAGKSPEERSKHASKMAMAGVKKRRLKRKLEREAKAAAREARLGAESART